jgi:hypothetical protein
MRFIQDPQTLELVPVEDYYGPGVRTHLVAPDLPGYESPVTGQWIDGRKARREDLKRNHCRPYELGEREHFLKNRDRDFDRHMERVIDRALHDVVTNSNLKFEGP